jgi:ribosomal protein L24E
VLNNDVSPKTCFCASQIQTGNGEVTITNDGATILKQISVTHPAAKMVNIFTIL